MYKHSPADRLRKAIAVGLEMRHLARTDEPRDAIPAGAVLVWVEPLDTLRLEADLVKGLSHKYIKRVPYTRPDGRRSYRYWYAIPGKDHLAHSEHLVEGAAFKVDGGHHHVTKVDGDIIHVRHDETGEEKRYTREEFARALQAHHKDAIEQRYRRLRADHVQAHKTGTAAQRAGAKAALDRHVEMYGRPEGEGPEKEGEKAKEGAKEAKDTDAPESAGAAMLRRLVGGPSADEAAVRAAFQASQSPADKKAAKLSQLREQLRRIHEANPNNRDAGRDVYAQIRALEGENKDPDKGPVTVERRAESKGHATATIPDGPGQGGRVWFPPPPDAVRAHSVAAARAAAQVPGSDAARKVAQVGLDTAKQSAVHMERRGILAAGQGKVLAAALGVGRWDEARQIVGKIKSGTQRGWAEEMISRLEKQQTAAAPPAPASPPPQSTPAAKLREAVAEEKEKEKGKGADTDAPEFAGATPTAGVATPATPHTAKETIDQARAAARAGNHAEAIRLAEIGEKMPRVTRHLLDLARFVKRTSGYALDYAARKEDAPTEETLQAAQEYIKDLMPYGAPQEHLDMLANHRSPTNAEVRRALAGAESSVAPHKAAEVRTFWQRPQGGPLVTRQNGASARASWEDIAGHMPQTAPASSASQPSASPAAKLREAAAEKPSGEAKGGAGDTEREPAVTGTRTIHDAMGNKHAGRPIAEPKGAYSAHEANGKVYVLETTPTEPRQGMGNRQELYRAAGFRHSSINGGWMIDKSEYKQARDILDGRREVPGTREAVRELDKSRDELLDHRQKAGIGAPADEKDHENADRRAAHLEAYAEKAKAYAEKAKNAKAAGHLAASPDEHKPEDIEAKRARAVEDARALRERGKELRKHLGEKWTKGKVKLAIPGAPEEVDAHIMGGYAVHAASVGKGHNVTHVNTGLSVSRNVASAKDAKELVHELHAKFPKMGKAKTGEEANAAAEAHNTDAQKRGLDTIADVVGRYHGSAYASRQRKAIAPDFIGGAPLAPSSGPRRRCSSGR